MRQKQQQTHKRNGKTQNTHTQTNTHIILANYVKKQVEKENTKKLF